MSIKITSLLFTILLFAACTPSGDLSTDEGAMAAYEAQVGYTFDNPDHFCIKRPSSFPNVILVGSFAYDAGCIYDGIFVNGEFGTVRDMTAAALQQNGWADEAKRGELAYAWADDIFYNSRHVLTSLGRDEEAFTQHGKTFAPPAIEPTETDGITITAWTSQSGGMLPEEYFSLRQLTFYADGSLGIDRELDSFTLQYE